MFAITANRTSAPRIVAVSLMLVIAAAGGLAVGSVLQSWTQEEAGAATSGFSLEALEAVRVTRGDAAAAVTAPAIESDYGLRHGAAAEHRAAANAESDYGLRHGAAAERPASAPQRASGAPQPE
jgi:hypothetical protein